MPATPGFAERLKAAIGERPIAELAKAARVSRQSFYDWQHGTIPNQEPPVRRLAKALGVPFEQLWGDASKLALDDRTRLAVLETFASGVRGLVVGLDAQLAHPAKLFNPAGDQRITTGEMLAKTIGGGAATKPGKGKRAS